MICEISQVAETTGKMAGSHCVNKPLWFLFILMLSVSCGRKGTIIYSVADSPWPESNGNHRAVLLVPESADAVMLDFLWRRHDRNPAEKRFLIVDAQSGDTIENVYRYQADQERCKIAFGPVRKKGVYYFYYLPYEVQKTWGFFDKEYLKPEPKPGEGWLKSSGIKDSAGNELPKATVTEIQSRTTFDSFYPMEIIPTLEEKQGLVGKFTDEYLLFPEGRENPIRMKDELPLQWVRKGPSNFYSARVCRNEYFAFQIGFFAVKKNIENVQVEFSTLKGKKGEIPAAALTCFNTGGIDPYGKPFIKRVNVALGKIQPFWIGIDIPRDMRPGSYKGIVTIKPGNAEARSIEIKLEINNNVLADRGDGEPWRHSRLRWLNSTAGLDDEVVAPYTPLTIQGKTISCMGRSVRLNDQGLPETIESWGHEMLAEPLHFVVETGTGISSCKESTFKITDRKNGIIQWESKSENKDFTLICKGNMEFDGHLNFSCDLIPKSKIMIRDIRLEIPFRSSCTGYMMGMSLPGGFTPKSHTSKWKSTEDSFWIGSPEAGVHCEFVGGTYNGPMLNLYRPEPPRSWNNEGKGGFRIERGSLKTLATVFSGNRALQPESSLHFEWNMLITPVKQIQYKSQFTDRYYHDINPQEEDIRAGIKIINVHHANVYNPYINYPFIHVQQMKDFIDRWHARGMKVKIYYTIRELTDHVTELWALRSLDDEILGSGSGGGYPWLREHLIDNYRHQWFQPFDDIPSDAAIVNSGGVNRWYNYYIEGLAWLVKNVGIDGLYLDDVAYNRQILKRMSKVMERTKPGCIIDLHSNTGFSLGPANQYAEFFPFIDKLWFGESFDYNHMPPENWLVEASGIPFGLMGDMLQDGGNRWRGMIYGMTARHPWASTADPRPVWKIWDEFGIDSADMKGYWEDCPIRTSRPDVLATAYVKKGEILISLASWSAVTVKVKLVINWKAIGLDAHKAILTAPEIKDFQEGASFKPEDDITLDPGKGWLLYLKDSH
jgi:hypothetical protein